MTSDSPSWLVYMIRCHDGSLYTGITTDVLRRVEEHQQVASSNAYITAKGAKALRGKGPLTLVFTYPAADRSVASKLEYRIKRLRKAEKENLIAGILPIESLENVIEGGE